MQVGAPWFNLLIFALIGALAPTAEGSCTCGQFLTTIRTCVIPGLWGCSLYLTTTTCRNCPAGQSSTAWANTCSNCAAGTYSATARSCSCFNCFLGQYSEGTGNTACSTCARGRYADSLIGGTECKSCPAGRYGTMSSAWIVNQCANCGAGQYSNAGSVGCTSCGWGRYVQKINIKAFS